MRRSPRSSKKEGTFKRFEAPAPQFERPREWKDLSEEEQKAEVKRYIELRDRQEKAEAERGAKKEAAAKAKTEAEEKAEADAELARRAEKKAVYIPAAEDKNEDEQDKEAFKECGEVTDY